MPEVRNSYAELMRRAGVEFLPGASLNHQVGLKSCTGARHIQTSIKHRISKSGFWSFPLLSLYPRGLLSTLVPFNS